MRKKARIQGLTCENHKAHVHSARWSTLQERCKLLYVCTKQLRKCKWVSMRAHKLGKDRQHSPQLVWSTDILALSPGPFPAFQCCTLKSLPLFSVQHWKAGNGPGDEATDIPTLMLLVWDSHIWQPSHTLTLDIAILTHIHGQQQWK